MILQLTPSKMGQKLKNISINLKHGNKVDIISVNHFIDELAQFFNKSLVLLEPRSMEMETQRSPVGFKMAVKVVAQNSSKLFWF